MCVGKPRVITHDAVELPERGVLIAKLSPDVTSIENRILCNEIYANQGIGIDLADDLFSFDDPGDADMGPNVQQNAPLLTSFALSGQDATIGGTLNSTPACEIAGMK